MEEDQLYGQAVHLRHACETMAVMDALETRVRRLNDSPAREDGQYVLYWIQANRRADSNHALAWALRLANTAGVPLLVYEGLTCAYPNANDRLHTFILEGVPGLQTDLTKAGIGYFFYLRRSPAFRNDMLYRLAERAICVVTDDYPAFNVVDHNRSVPQRVGIPFYAVDASCIVPMNIHEKRNWAAYTIRPKIHRELPNWLKPVPVEKPAQLWNDALIPQDVVEHRTSVTPENIPELVASCAINHSIPVSQSFRGGTAEARRRLTLFLESRLYRYAKESNQPAKRSTSDMSPYLHFGHISALEIALAVKDYADEHQLLPDEYLEELIVRRELAFNFARFVPNPETLDVLPEWALKTMAQHASDPRPVTYTYEQLLHGETYDDLWNATQQEMLIEGKIHGYYRMYWGKKIIEWSPTMEDALKTMFRIHDTYALDGRDPNTATNILWCFGLHDRPWFERPIFGQLRYMSLDGMRRKTDVAAYIRQVASPQANLL
jgi:deoxyribodipyrimidine photo-lyase